MTWREVDYNLPCSNTLIWRHNIKSNKISFFAEEIRIEVKHKLFNKVGWNFWLWKGNPEHISNHSCFIAWRISCFCPKGDLEIISIWNFSGWSWTVHAVKSIEVWLVMDIISPDSFFFRFSHCLTFKYIKTKAISTNSKGLNLFDEIRLFVKLPFNFKAWTSKSVMTAMVITNPRL